MTTWLKKLRLYLYRRELLRIRRYMFVNCLQISDYDWARYCDQRADLINRIAELEKSL